MALVAMEQAAVIDGLCRIHRAQFVLTCCHSAFRCKNPLRQSRHAGRLGDYHPDPDLFWKTTQAIAKIRLRMKSRLTGASLRHS